MTPQMEHLSSDPCGHADHANAGRHHGSRDGGDQCVMVHPEPVATNEKGPVGWGVGYGS